ncbi:phage holin family protein [Serratia nevei]|uniref:phage holin family protein n=1 Tax=Serratia nevei TaxID=2703794 RepID=UPI00313C77AC
MWGGSAWGGIVRYLMENKASGKKFSWHEVFSQVVISGFTGFLAGVYGYEQGYSEFMTMVFSGLGGAFGGHLLDVLWKRFAHSLEKEKHSKH